MIKESIFLPYVNDTTQAPNLMLNSNVPGTYIVKLSEMVRNSIRNLLCCLLVYAITIIVIALLVYDIWMPHSSFVRCLSLYSVN